MNRSSFFISKLFLFSSLGAFSLLTACGGGPDAPSTGTTNSAVQTDLSRLSNDDLKSYLQAHPDQATSVLSEMVKPGRNMSHDDVVQAVTAAITAEQSVLNNLTQANTDQSAIQFTQQRIDTLKKVLAQLQNQNDSSVVAGSSSANVIQPVDNSDLEKAKQDMLNPPDAVLDNLIKELRAYGATPTTGAPSGSGSTTVGQ